MAHKTLMSAAAVLSSSLTGGSGGNLRTLFTAGLAIVAVGVLFSAMRLLAQVVSALAAAAAAVGGVFLLVVVFLGLFAAALLLRGPI